MNQSVFNRYFYLTATLLILCAVATPSSSERRYEQVQIESEFGYFNDGLYFAGNGEQAVVLVHQSESDKESWKNFAAHLQSQGIASVSIDKVGRREVLDAISFLSERKYEKVTLIGASIGGGAVLQAANTGPNKIEKVILLSPNAAVLDNSNIDKLFVVSKLDVLSARSYSVFKDSSEPKILKEYEGAAHGQDIFESDHGKDLTHLIFEFLKEAK